MYNSTSFILMSFTKGARGDQGIKGADGANGQPVCDTIYNMYMYIYYVL